MSTKSYSTQTLLSTKYFCYIPEMLFLQMMLTTEMKYVQIMTKSFCIENS